MSAWEDSVPTVYQAVGVLHWISVPGPQRHSINKDTETQRVEGTGPGSHDWFSQEPLRTRAGGMPEPALTTAPPGLPTVAGSRILSRHSFLRTPDPVALRDFFPMSLIVLRPSLFGCFCYS